MYTEVDLQRQIRNLIAVYDTLIEEHSDLKCDEKTVLINRRLGANFDILEHPSRYTIGEINNAIRNVVGFLTDTILDFKKVYFNLPTCVMDREVLTEILTHYATNKDETEVFCALLQTPEKRTDLIEIFGEEFNDVQRRFTSRLEIPYR